MRKKIFLWGLSVIITCAAVIYQRATGPTNPKKEKITINNMEYTLKLPRSHGSEKYEDCEVKLNIIDHEVNGTIYYRTYPGESEWDSSKFFREEREVTSLIKNKIYGIYEEDVLISELPYQPPAGKMEYYIKLQKNDKTYTIAKKNPVIIRFKGDVPAYFLIPHVVLMFATMLIANLAGLYAIWKVKRYKFYTFLAGCTLLVGGMILGPVVQKYAFNDWWTGIPFGWDLTDNKTLIAFIAFLAAIIGNWRKDRRYLTIIASVVLLVIYSIPHSLFGSELNRETGEIIQAGLILVIVPNIQFIKKCILNN